MIEAAEHPAPPLSRLRVATPRHPLTCQDLGWATPNRTYLNLNPHGEPQLGRHGLYAAAEEGEEGRARNLALLWVLNLSDGRHDLLAIAERSGLAFTTVRRAADALLAAGLLREVKA